MSINEFRRGVVTASSSASIAADDVVAVVESVLAVSSDERVVNAGGALGLFKRDEDLVLVLPRPLKDVAVVITGMVIGGRGEGFGGRASFLIFFSKALRVLATVAA